MTKKQSIISLIASLALVVLTSGLSSLLSKNGMESYPNLAKPSLAPPGIVFPIVWGILFFLMAISSWLILKELTQTFSIKGALLSTPILLYFAQLLVNFFWSILFFRFGWYLFAFFWLLLLIFLVYKMIRSFERISHIAAYLQIPYLLWLVFAGYLNLGVWVLN